MHSCTRRSITVSEVGWGHESWTVREFSTACHATSEIYSTSQKTIVKAALTAIQQGSRKIISPLWLVFQGPLDLQAFPTTYSRDRNRSMQNKQLRKANHLQGHLSPLKLKPNCQFSFNFESLSSVVFRDFLHIFKFVPIVSNILTKPGVEVCYAS